MEHLTENSLTAHVSHDEQSSHSEKRQNWLLSCGFISLTSGALAPVVGSLSTAMSWLVGNNAIGHWLHRFGSIFLISTFPLLIIAAFLLDAYEKQGNRINFDW